jgi:flagellar M-ring protein FliF
MAADPNSGFEEGAAVSRGSTDTEYDYGRRVEQVVAAPGGVTRLSVGVIVPGATDLATQERIEDLVRVAAGINDTRGDLVVVQSLDGISPDPASVSPPTAAVEAEKVEAAVLPAASPAAETPWWNRWYLWAGAGLLFAVLLLMVLVGRGSQGRLSADERARLLADVRASLERGPRMTAAGGAP